MKLTKDDIAEIALACVGGGGVKWIAITRTRPGKGGDSFLSSLAEPIEDGVYITLDRMNGSEFSIDGKALTLCLGYYTPSRDDVHGSYLWAKATHLASDLNNGEFNKLLEAEFVQGDHHD